MSSLRQLSRKIILALLSTVVIVLVVEVTLRLFFPRYNPLIPAAYEYDPDFRIPASARHSPPR